MSNEKKQTMYDRMTEHAEKMRLANGDHFELKGDVPEGMPGVDATGHGALVMMAIVEAAKSAEIRVVMSPAMIAVMNQCVKVTRAVSIAVFDEFRKQAEECPPELAAQIPSMQAFVLASIIGTVETNWRGKGQAINNPRTLALLRVFSEAGEKMGQAIAEGINEEVLKEKTMAIVNEAIAKAKRGRDPSTLTDDEVRQILRRPRGNA